ncbi:hypothetical protein SNE510_73170 [Streptomyces sp. NE5-10]|nr:hypothetical protein SNE510_73170 [Streptomyces sp. NE5-10]
MNTKGRSGHAPETESRSIAHASGRGGRAPVERDFAPLKNWRILTKPRTGHARATHLFRALFVLTNSEATTGN